MYSPNTRRQRQDLTECVQAIQAAQQRNHLYLIIFTALLVFALGALWVAGSTLGVFTLVHVWLLLVAALITGVLLWLPK